MPEGFGDAAGNDLGGLGHVTGLEQHGELVAPEAGHGVTGPGRASQPLGDGDEQLVAGGVAEAVVDHLEVVDV